MLDKMVFLHSTAYKTNGLYLIVDGEVKRPILIALGHMLERERENS